MKPGFHQRDRPSCEVVLDNEGRVAWRSARHGTTFHGTMAAAQRREKSKTPDPPARRAGRGLCYSPRVADSFVRGIQNSCRDEPLSVESMIASGLCRPHWGQAGERTMA